jgi:hypothetical protein
MALQPLVGFGLLYFIMMVRILNKAEHRHLRNCENRLTPNFGTLYYSSVYLLNNFDYKCMLWQFLALVFYKNLPPNADNKVVNKFSCLPGFYFGPS